MSECEDLTNIPISDLITRAERTALETAQKLKSLGLHLALSESCTAGLISALLANMDGASAILWGSYVCYKQEAKVAMLDLDNDALNMNGLVSRQTACSMSKSALEKSGADITAAVTGLAGQESDGKVTGGTIWVAAARRGKEITAKEYLFKGSRNAVRTRAAIAVLELILNGLDN